MASQRPETLAGAPAHRARLLLVEDDASIRRFVCMALEDLAVDVVEAGTLAEARRALAEGDYSLLLTDLMLPDGDGLSLLAASPATGQRSVPRVVVFSAGIAPAVRRQALALGAWRVLDKPAPLAALSACVRDALADRNAQRDVPDASAPTPRPAASDDRAAAPGAPTPADVRRDAAIKTHFAGQAALFDRFRAASLLQFPADLADGEAALARGDIAALRRLAHSLKTVLQLLGDDDASAWARRLESAAVEGSTPQTLAPLWRSLRQAVLAQG
jgi:DNA-binding response OmpR family regulator